MLIHDSPLHLFSELAREIKEETIIPKWLVDLAFYMSIPYTLGNQSTKFPQIFSHISLKAVYPKI